MRPSSKLLLASCLLPLSCLAQPLDTPPPLDLATAETLLLEANPAILQARSAVAGARAGMDIAGARPNPTLSAAVTSINPARNSAGGYWDRPMDSVLRLDQTFERGDKRELRLRAADRNLAATDADLDNTIRLARMALANAWLNLRAAQEIRQIAAESARLAGRAAEAAELRGKAGDLAGVDVARFAADAARVANDAVQADLDHARARLDLALLLGNRVVPDSLQAAADWPDATLPANEGKERPDLLAARQRLALADAQRDLARAQRTRDVSVGVQYEHFPPDARNTYGISVSIPLFLGNDYRGDIARSEAEFTAAEQQLAATRAAVDGERARLRSEYAARATRLQRIRDVVLPAAERAGRGADIAIQKGGMGLTDYLDTQRNLRAARIEAIQARADLSRVALMLRLAGSAP